MQSYNYCDRRILVLVLATLFLIYNNNRFTFVLVNVIRIIINYIDYTIRLYSKEGTLRDCEFYSGEKDIRKISVKEKINRYDAICFRLSNRPIPSFCLFHKEYITLLFR